jgi:hypothetical protein
MQRRWYYEHLSALAAVYYFKKHMISSTRVNGAINSLSMSRSVGYKFISKFVKIQYIFYYGQHTFYVYVC